MHKNTGGLKIFFKKSLVHPKTLKICDFEPKKDHKKPEIYEIPYLKHQDSLFHTKYIKILIALFTFSLKPYIFYIYKNCTV